MLVIPYKIQKFEICEIYDRSIGSMDVSFARLFLDFI